ncbi:MAG: phosphoribosylanthranilate isomerase [Phycisphaerales bacterium]
MTRPARTRVKICGVRDVETARVCAAHGVDAVGLVFAQVSPRLVTPETAHGIVRALPPFVVSVGLFVDATADEIVRVCERVGLGMVQLHGSESPEDCQRVRERTGLPVLKAVRFDHSTIGATIEAYRGVCVGLLVDGSVGGMGETFDWSALATHASSPAVPILVAGGLTHENVGACITMVRPYAVDVSSGVESSRGVKAPALIGSFLAQVRRADGGAS